MVNIYKEFVNIYKEFVNIYHLSVMLNEYRPYEYQNNEFLCSYF